MRILSKQQSDYTIKKLNLNRVDERILHSNQMDELKKYLSESKSTYFNIRDKSTSMGTFLYKLTKEEIIKESVSYDKYSVYESFYEADKGLVLQGEILIDKKFQLTATLDDKLNISNREAMKYPKYRITADLLNDRDPNIRGLTKVLDYIIVNELFDSVVEFTLFSQPVGTNKEEIIIWEIRNY